MVTNCENPKCKSVRNYETNCFLHSTHYYWPEEATTRNYFWACEECVSLDHDRYKKGKINIEKARGIPWASREY